MTPGKRTPLRLFTVVALLTSAALLVQAQPRKYDTYSDIKANPDMAGGVYYNYEMVDWPCTPAPKGYKPVYINHIGRHGSRYALGEKIYEEMYAFLDKADREGKFTPEGQRFLSRYKALYPEVARRAGELTLLGQAQHRFIAAKMYRDYKPLFKGDTKAQAISTKIHRVLVSMAAFLDELEDLDAKFDYRMDYGLVYLPFLEPAYSESPEAIEFKATGQEAEKAYSEMWDKVGIDGIVSRLFSDPEWVEGNYGKRSFVSDLSVIILDTQCLDSPSDRLDGILTFDELFAVYEARNLRYYIRYALSPLGDRARCLQTYSVVEDFINKADADMASGQYDMALRFSHDTGLMPLLSFMGVDGMDVEIEDPAQVKDYWRSLSVPMACNLQLVLFENPRSKVPSDKLLVKCLLNGKEAKLPFEAFKGPFYRWSDFKTYYGKKIEDAKEYLKAYQGK